MTTGVLAGAFDVIHPGYIAAFKEARSYCDYLIILLHEDPSVENPEKKKPVLSTWERAEILLSIIYVNSVMFYQTEAELEKILSKLDYDIRFLGNDYIGKPYTGRTDVPVHYLDRSHGWSSTKFKQLIKDSYEKFE